MNGLGGAGRLNPRARLLSSVLPSPIPLCILSLLSSTQPSHLLSSTPFCSFDVSLVVLLLALLGRNSAFVLPTNRRVRRCGDGRGASQPAAAAGHRHSPPDAVRIALAPHSASTAARCTTHSTAHPPLPPARRLVCSRALAFPFSFFLSPPPPWRRSSTQTTCCRPCQSQAMQRDDRERRVRKRLALLASALSEWPTDAALSLPPPPTAAARSAPATASKEDNLEYDLGNLTAYDPAPIPAHSASVHMHTQLATDDDATSAA